MLLDRVGFRTCFDRGVGLNDLWRSLPISSKLLLFYDSLNSEKTHQKVHGMWKEGQATWEEYRNVVRACRDAKRKANVHLELNLARDVKNNTKGFFKYISSKRKTSNNVGPLLN